MKGSAHGELNPGKDIMCHILNTSTLYQWNKRRMDMTNGEKIKEIFPKANIKMPTIFETKVKVIIDLDCKVAFPIEWWDAEYKEPTEKTV